MTAAEEMQLAALAFDAISKIIEAVRSAKAGATDPGVALAGITAVHDALAGNNALVDAEERQRFDVP